MTDQAADRASTTSRRLAIGRGLSPPVATSLGRRLWGLVWSWLLASVVLGATIALTPGIEADTLWDVILAALVASVISWALRPVLARLGVALGWVGVFLLALFAPAIIIYVSLSLSPGIEFDGFWSAFLASWVFAIVISVAGWLDSVDEEEVFLGHIVRSALRRSGGAPLVDPEQDGVVFVQMDGVSQPLLRHALMAGNLPTLNRWVRSGTHSVDGWTARVPSTTPVSQAGILHGTTDAMPAFRWYEKGREGQPGRLLVANNPPDATLIESRVSNGLGLLADDGASIGNIFTGDAEVTALTMSGVGKNRREGLGSANDYAAFFSSPFGFTRAFVATIGEMVKEVFQSRRAIRKDIDPRVHRHGSYIALRGVTNVFLRDLNLALVAEQMMKGRKSIYVDFLDYDEIAHHAGLARPESMAAIEGIDRVLGQIEKVAVHAPRTYHVVVVSDHGQSQGATFKQRNGASLEELVHQLMGGDAEVVAATGREEEYGQLNAFLGELSAQSSVTATATRAALRRRTDEDGTPALGPQNETAAAAESGVADVVVAGSGNLGLVWFAREPGRLTFERMDEIWPGLVGTLSTNEHVGFVVVMTEADGVVALGRGGVHVLETGEVRGDDPLAPFGPHAVADMLRCAQFPNAPDIYLNSSYDESTMEVAAFEELVGCHGGLGGWQTEPVLVHPAGWPLNGPLVGAEALHDQLVRWLVDLGHRQGLVSPAPYEGAPTAEPAVAGPAAGPAAAR